MNRNHGRGSGLVLRRPGSVGRFRDSFRTRSFLAGLPGAVLWVCLGGSSPRFGQVKRSHAVPVAWPSAFRGCAARLRVYGCRGADARRCGRRWLHYVSNFLSVPGRCREGGFASSLVLCVREWLARVSMAWCAWPCLL